MDILVQLVDSQRFALTEPIGATVAQGTSAFQTVDPVK